MYIYIYIRVVLNFQSLIFVQGTLEFCLYACIKNSQKKSAKSENI